MLYTYIINRLGIRFRSFFTIRIHACVVYIYIYIHTHMQKIIERIGVQWLSFSILFCIKNLKILSIYLIT